MVTLKAGKSYLITVNDNGAYMWINKDVTLS